MCRYPIRRKNTDPRVGEIVEAAWRDWWDNVVPGGGRSKVRDSARVVLEVAQRHGRFIEVIVEGESAERSPCG